jgi:hypothetical protein
MSKERSHTNTTLSLAPFTVDEALAAIPHTPPLPAEKKEPKRKRAKKGKAR